MPDDAHAPRLAALTVEVADDLRKLGDPARPWSWAPDGFDANVLVVGAGQCGLAAAFGLKRAGVADVQVVSRDPIGQEGPWRTFAEMPTLRSPKQAPGPELGIPNLTYEAWHRARYGDAHYAALDLIPTEDWAQYLEWFRTAVGVDVAAGVAVTAFKPIDGGVEVATEAGGTIRAREVVLATGMDAFGGPKTPEQFASLPERLRPHCYQPMDFGPMRGEAIAVIGAASTAFDYAAAALEAGAAKVDLYCRGPRLRSINHMKGVADYGAVAHWADFDDAARWRFAYHGVRRAAPPIEPTVRRACVWPNFNILLNADVEAAEALGEGLRIRARGAWRSYDRALLAAGYEIDLKRKPELASLATTMARWSDVYEPPHDLADATLGAFPYLTPGFAFTPRPGLGDDADWVGRVRLFAGPAVVSMGRVVGESGNLRYGVPRLVTAVTRALAQSDVGALYDRAASYAVEETAFADYAANAVDLADAGSSGDG